MNLQEFLSSLTKRGDRDRDRTPLPDDVESAVRQVDGDVDFVDVFERAAEAAGACVRRASGADWLTAIAGILRELDATRICTQAAEIGFLSRTQSAELSEHLRESGMAVSTDTGDDELFAADASITGVSAAITESGTVVCESGPNAARGASLVPPVHIAVVDAAQIVPDLCDYFEQLPAGPELPANVNLITGPSKTADIEGMLVTGVHGPGKLFVVVVTTGS